MLNNGGFSSRSWCIFPTGQHRFILSFGFDEFVTISYIKKPELKFSKTLNFAHIRLMGGDRIN